MTERKGPIEAATRAMVRDLGALSARQRVTAEAAYRVAANLDAEFDGSKASALSRELRQLVATLTPAAMPVAKPQGEPHHDPVQAAQDELARKRRERGGSG